MTNREKEMLWRRFELTAPDSRAEERLIQVIANKELTREDLAVILLWLRVRPGFSREDFGV